LEASYLAVTPKTNPVPSKKKKKKTRAGARCHWLMPVILAATWEAEIRRGGSRFEASWGK
jgi:hypothetical protein